MGEVEIKVVIDHVHINPGVAIYCDPDGILVERPAPETNR